MLPCWPLSIFERLVQKTCNSGMQLRGTVRVEGYGLHGWPRAQSSLGGGLASAVSLLVTLLAFLATGILVFFQWVRGKRFDVVLLAGLSLGAWGMASRSVPEWIFTLLTSAFLGVAVFLTVAGFSGA